MAITVYPTPSPVEVSLPPLTFGVFTQMDVTTTEAAAPTTNLAGRITISIEALEGNGANIFVIETGQATTDGWELQPGASIDMDYDDTMQLYVIAASGTQRCSIAEAG